MNKLNAEKSAPNLRNHWPIALLITVFLGIGALYATLTPAWQAPDEPAHYNYIRQLADGHFPVMEAGDYDQAYQSEVIGAGFPPQLSVDPFEYEDYQPPLYYLLQTPVYHLSDGDLVAMRLFSVLLGAGVILLGYGLGRVLFPDQRWIALTAAAFVAFLPQHVAMLSALNNDALSELLIAALLLLLVLGLQRSSGPSRRQLLGLGLLLGLAFLTKVTAYLMAPAIAVGLFVHFWSAERDKKQAVIHFMRASAFVFVPAALIGLLWWGRNIAIYPGLDFLGIQAHDRIVTGQPTSAEWVAQFGLSYTVRAFLTTSFHSFWGQFGWMGVPMPSWVYNPLLLFTVATAIGAAIYEWRPQLAVQPVIKGSIRLAFAALVLLNVALLLVYNLSYVQHQGRYLFAALVPIGLVTALGWATLMRPLRRWQPLTAWLLPLAFAVGLAALDLVALFKFILPVLAD